VIRIEELSIDGVVSAARLALADTVDAHALDRESATLPDEVRALCAAHATESRRAGFLGGRLALRAALEAASCPDARRGVLRDARGRPVASWPGAPAFSIAHTRRRAAAIVATDGADAVGIDLEEIDARRAEALVRKALSATELERIEAGRPVDLAPGFAEGPIAAWCAREACVKAHGLEVGWFGTALEVVGFDPVAAPPHAAGPAWRVRIAHEGMALDAVAWRQDGAILAVATLR
jgi:4'-phosphopantetheinyl transferase EntD